MTTKEQEFKALAQIKKIVDGLGEDSYIAMAFEGCFEIAEENIQNDWGCSMKQRAESAEKKIEMHKTDTANLLKAIAEKDRMIERLKQQLELEQEWKPYIDEGAVSDNDYVTGKAAAHQIMEDKEAREWIEYEFGFAMSKIEILSTKPEFEVSRHGQLRKIGEINREPWYNATDWYYVQFQVCGMAYEAYNGSLIKR